jgi:zinc transport system substrate-binding protein
MVDIARKKNINTVFIQSQFETSKAEVIAREIGAKIVPIDPLAENWLAEMYSLTDKMKVALAKDGR